MTLDDPPYSDPEHYYGRTSMSTEAFLPCDVEASARLRAHWHWLVGRLACFHRLQRWMISLRCWCGSNCGLPTLPFSAFSLLFWHWVSKQLHIYFTLFYCYFFLISYFSFLFLAKLHRILFGLLLVGLFRVVTMDATCVDNIVRIPTARIQRWRWNMIH